MSFTDRQLDNAARDLDDPQWVRRSPQMARWEVAKHRQWSAEHDKMKRGYLVAKKHRPSLFSRLAGALRSLFSR